MKIFHNAKMMHEFTEIILSRQIQASKERKGFHRSDAISCPMKCFNRMMGMEAIFSPRAIGFFVLGNLAHIALHKYFDAQEKEIEIAGIILTIDALHGKYPIESKTTRRKIYKKTDIPEEWLEQLAFGMSVLGVNRGFLLVINVINFAVMVWEVQMDERERDIFKGALVAKIYKIAKAIKTKDYSDLEIRREECEWCQYRPIRGKREGCPLYSPLPKKIKRLI